MAIYNGNIIKFTSGDLGENVKVMQGGISVKELNPQEIKEAW